MKKQFLTTTIRPIDKTGEDFDLPSPNLLEGLPGLLDIITRIWDVIIQNWLIWKIRNRNVYMTFNRSEKMNCDKELELE
jgi:hypothetical protein